MAIPNDGTPSPNTLESVMRFTASQTPDNTFGANRTTAIALPGNISSSFGSFAARVQNDGKIVALSQATMNNKDGTSKNVVVVSRILN
jgi:hypothetical protein